VNVPTTIDAAAWLGKYLEGANGDTDLAQAMLAAFAEALMSAEASMQCGAAYGERTPERENSRNGYRLRPWDTRVGSIELAVPKLRRGVYSPEFLLQPRRRAEQALVAVICAAYVEGVSTRRVDDLVKAMGIDGISKSEVSRMASALDKVVTEFKERPLSEGPYRYLWIDALTQRVREGGRVVNVSAVIATAVNAEGKREIIGFEIATTEDTAAWTAFLRALVARGLSGVELVISDAHGGIKAAIAQVFSDATWQRCRTHFMANLASRVAKGNWPMIATLVRSIFEQPDRDTTWSQLADVTDKLTQAGFVDVVTYLLDAADDILAFSAFPAEHWPKIRSNNPQERINKEIRRRTDVVGIFPNRAAVIRLVGALLAEQTDEWAITKRYMSAESLKTTKVLDPSPEDPRPAIDAAAKEVTTASAT
jgi:transposase-like protein